MTLADDLKPVITAIRAIPGELGLRPYSVSVVVRFYSGTHPGDGSYFDVATPILENGQNPKVRFADDEAIALSNGAIGKGTITAGPITPDHAGGGTSLDTLNGKIASNAKLLHYLVTGPDYPNGARFRKVDVGSDHALHYTIRLSPIEENE